MWVYLVSEPGLYTVGFYSPDGEWHPDTDWPSRNEAANRVSFLNGRSESPAVTDGIPALDDATKMGAKG